MTLNNILFLVMALAICVTVHEAAHAWVASKLGDQTAKMQGRVSLNPARHLDPIGTLMIFLIQFGWGKPVMINEQNLKNPRRDAAIISLAGPMANFITAFLVALLIRFAIPDGYIFTLLKRIYELSLVLFLFNLLPVAPLDGSKLIGLVVPKSMDAAYERYMSQGYIYLIVIIILDRFLGQILDFSPLGYYFAFGYEYITIFIGLIT